MTPPPGAPLHILISGGGTGGGVYPALAVASALKRQHPDVEILWMGSSGGMERDLVARAGLPYAGVAGGPVVGVGLRALPNAVRLLAGTAQALRRVGSFQPDAMLITGGWPTIPPALAGWLRRVPLLIYLPDLEPGAAVRALSRLASRVAVTAPSAAEHFRAGQAVLTGYPLRADVLRAAGFDALGEPLHTRGDTRPHAGARFDLDDALPTLLVMGGSRGARSINRALLSALPDLLGVAQIIHLTGTLDAAEVEAEAAALTAALPPETAARYHPFPYLHSEDMALALAAADLVVARAGASSLGEFPLFGLPAILVPYPHAWRYQKTNADYLVSRGAAEVLADERLGSDLAPLARALLLDDRRRAQMATAARKLRHPAAAARIAAHLAELAGRPGASGESRGED